MKRRAFLAMLGTVATSGCTAQAILGTDPPPDPRWISVEDVRREPPADPEQVAPSERPTDLAITVDIVDDRIDATTPARIAIQYTNTGTTSLSLNLNPDTPDPHHSAQTDPGLVLLPDDYDPDSVEHGCWHPQAENFPVHPVVYERELPPGEDLHLPYEVWAAPEQTATCIQSGTYQFDVLYGSFTLVVHQDDPTS